MKTSELLDQVKEKTGAISDYKLAQVLDFSKQKVSHLRSGKIRPDAYECARIAVALERDPLEVMAEIGAENAKTEKAREFWKSFFSGLKRTAHGIAWLGVVGFIGQGLPAGNAEAASLTTSHNVYYVKLAAHWIGCAQARMFVICSGWMELSCSGRGYGEIRRDVSLHQFAAHS